MQHLQMLFLKAPVNPRPLQTLILSALGRGGSPMNHVVITVSSDRRSHGVGAVIEVLHPALPSDPYGALLSPSFNQAGALHSSLLLHQPLQRGITVQTLLWDPVASAVHIGSMVLSLPSLSGRSPTTCCPSQPPGQQEPLQKLTLYPE